MEASSALGNVEARRSFKTEAAIRTLLADRFIFEDWYPQVREIVARGEPVTVFATLPPPGEAERKIANEICAAVLTYHLVGDVEVRDGPRSSVACP